jgi:hypothetical protein
MGLIKELPVLVVIVDMPRLPFDSACGGDIFATASVDGIVGAEYLGGRGGDDGL